MNSVNEFWRDGSRFVWDGGWQRAQPYDAQQQLEMLRAAALPNAPSALAKSLPLPENLCPTMAETYLIQQEHREYVKAKELNALFLSSRLGRVAWRIWDWRR